MAESYNAILGDVPVFVVDDDEPGACGRWIAAENPSPVEP